MFPLHQESTISTTNWCVRRVLRVPYRAHCNLLPAICDDLPPDVQLKNRFLKFISVGLNSTNAILRTCSEHALYGHSSVTKNITAICDELSIDRQYLRMIRKVGWNPDNDPTVGQLHQFIELRDDRYTTNLMRNHVQEMIDYLCTK